VASSAGGDQGPERDLRRAMHGALAGGTAVVLATVSLAGIPATALCTWVVAIGTRTIAIALDHRSSAYINISAGSTHVAIEMLADDLVIAARGTASIRRVLLQSTPFPCGGVIVDIDEIRDHSVKGIRFHAPTYVFDEDKRHRRDMERAIFSELASLPM
jgi:hypothetical protein